MSSTAFVVELRVDERGRRLVWWSGAALACVGAGLLAATPIPVFLRILLLVIWLWDCVRSFRRLWRGWQRVECLRLSSAGTVQVVGHGESPVAVRLLTGTTVTRRVAWLRFARPGGPLQTELLLAANAEVLVWQRFQLIWRLCRESFGHPGTA